MCRLLKTLALAGGRKYLGAWIERNAFLKHQLHNKFTNKYQTTKNYLNKIIKQLFLYQTPFYV
jgi:hypothetical protein